MTYLAFNRDDGALAGEIDVIDTSKPSAGAAPMVVTGENGLPYGPPASFACAPDGFYFADGTTAESGRDIYFVPLADLTTAQKIYTHSTWVTSVRIRNDPTSQKGYRVFFAASQQPNTFTPARNIYYLKDDNTAALYLTIDPSTLLLPDPCACGAEGAVYARWEGSFCFDPNNGLYVSTGNCTPGAIWKASGATATGVTGQLKTIISWADSTIPDQFDCLAFEGGSLYYTSDLNIVKLDLDPSQGTPIQQTLVLSIAPYISPYWHCPEDVGVCISTNMQHHVTVHTVGEAKFPDISKRVVHGSILQGTGTIELPTPHPDPERVLQAQDWAIRELSKKGIKTSVTALTKWSLRFREVGTVDQFSGTLVDQTGKWHSYTVRMTKSGKIMLEGSMVR